MRTFFTIVALALLAVVNAAIINVSVGPNNTVSALSYLHFGLSLTLFTLQLTYSPNSVTAQNGDLVVFTLYVLLYIDSSYFLTNSDYSESKNHASPL